MASYGLPYRIREDGWPSDPSLGRHIGFTKPVFAFFPSIAISNLVEVQGDEFPLWRDDLLVTSLKDMAIWRLRRDGNRIVYSERFSLEHRLRDIVELPGGQLALLTDDGKVLILRNTSDADASQQQSQIRVVGLEAVSEVFSRAPENEKGQATSAAGGKDLFDHYCATCHAMSQVPMPGPHLSGVVGRRIGSLQDYPYSMAMQNAEGVWTEERLIDFMSGRREDFPGTTMPFVNVPRIKDYKLIVQYLKETRQ
jgi:cytochrome c2